MKQFLYWMDAFLMRACWRVVVSINGSEHDLGWIMRSAALSWAADHADEVVRVEYCHSPPKKPVNEVWL